MASVSDESDLVSLINLSSPHPEGGRQQLCQPAAALAQLGVSLAPAPTGTSAQRDPSIAAGTGRLVRSSSLTCGESGWRNRRAEGSLLGSAWAGRRLTFRYPLQLQHGVGDVKEVSGIQDAWRAVLKGCHLSSWSGNVLLGLVPEAAVGDPLEAAGFSERGVRTWDQAALSPMPVMAKGRDGSETAALDACLFQQRVKPPPSSGLNHATR